MIHAEAGLIVNTGAWVHAELTMGAQYSFSQGFNIIWDYDFDYGYTEPTIDEIDIRVWVKPAISFPIKAKIYSVIGPIIRPEIYLLVTIKYIVDELFWSVKLGFNLSVGVCVGIPFFNDVCREWSIFDFTIKKWTSIDPPDYDPPTTEIHIYPKKNGWTGPDLWIWFNATDNGDIPSGVNETWFKISDNDWLLYNFSTIFNYTVPPSEYGPYLIRYFSKDYLGYEEEERIRSVNIDYRPPTSTISIGNPKNGQNIFSYSTPITFEAVDDLTGWTSWYRVGSINNGELSAWKNGKEETPITYYFTVEDEGEYYIEWCAVDGVWNLEEIHNNSFYVHTDLEVIYEVTLELHRVKAEDRLEWFWLDEADWYYHVGFSEDETNFFWQSSDIVIVENDDDYIIDETHTYYTDLSEIYIDFMFCDRDEPPFGQDDELADVSSDPYGGEDDKADVIYPPEYGIEPGSCFLTFDVINNIVSGPILEFNNEWLKTSGNFDNNPGDENDVSVWFNTSVTVYNILPVADFTYDPISPTIHDIIYFTDTSNDSDGNITEWYWEFGDGNNSTDQNPSHQYIDSGTYPVNLIITDEKDAIGKKMKNITVRKPVVYIYNDFNSSTPGWQIDHFDNIQDGIDAVDENGTAFLLNGTYYENIVINKTINLIGEDRNNTVIDGNGNDCAIYVDSSNHVNIRNLTIQNGMLFGIFLNHSNFNIIFRNDVTNNDFGILLYSSSNNTISENYVINSFCGIYLETISNNNSIYHNSFFNNFNAVDSCSNNWDNGYPSGGNYWDDYNGTDTNGDGIGDIPYDVPGGTNQDLYPLGYFHPIANFTYIPFSPTTADVVYFNSTSYDPDGTIVNWSWDFGDGIYSYNQFTTHQYSDNGTYTVTLNVTDDDGVTDETSQQIIVLNIGPTADFDCVPILPIVGEIVQFTDESNDPDGTIVSWLWDFGDGNTSTEQNQEHIFTSCETFNVSLTVTDDDGDINITSIQLITKVVYNNEIEAGDNQIDLTNESDTTIGINATYPTNITLEKYSGNPTQQSIPNNITSIGNYINITVENESSIVWPIDIKIFYTQDDLNDSNIGEDQLIGIYFWDDTIGEWQLYSDTGVNTEYNQNGYEGYCWANVWHLTLLAPGGDAEPPTKVTWLTVTDAKDGKLDLTWAEATDNIAVEYYNIYRDGLATPLTTVPHPEVSYQDTGLTNGQSYLYEVSAVDTSGNEGEKSDTKSGISTATDTGGNGGDTGGGGGGGGPGGPPANEPPQANASLGEPYVGYVGEEITFDGSLSNDTDGNITTWEWDFGDGTNGTGEIVTHTYSSVGTYTVVLTVIDDEGATDSYETIATISQPNIPPTTPEKISGPTEGSKNIEYNYTFLSTDDDNDTIKYSVDWEDGTTDESDFLPNGTAFEIAHSWTLAGKYIVTITADDNETITSTEMIVMIDAIDAGDIGYITDDDGDGTYDTFHDSGLETDLGQENGKYLIDSDGDGEWDYFFDLTEGLVSYQEEGQVKTPGFELIIGIISIALVFFFKRKKTESY